MQADYEDLIEKVGREIAEAVLDREGESCTQKITSVSIRYPALFNSFVCMSAHCRHAHQFPFQSTIPCRKRLP